MERDWWNDDEAKRKAIAKAWNDREFQEAAGQMQSMGAQIVAQQTKQGTLTGGNEVKACFCIGPQNGEPLCPCQMRGVQIINGRYVKVKDLGPVLPDGDRSVLR